MLRFQFLVFSFSLFIISCTNTNDKNIELNKLLTENLEQANYFILNNTEDGLTHVKGFIQDYQFGKYAEVTLVKIKQTMKEAQKAFDSVDILKNDFENQKKTITATIGNLIANYQQRLIEIDTNKQVSQLLNSSKSCFGAEPMSYAEMISKYGTEDEQSYKLMLTKVQNDIRIFENEYVITYGNRYYDCSDKVIWKARLMVNQNTSHLRNGELLKIGGAIAESQPKADLKVEINNKFYEGSKDGYLYEFKVEGKPGKHKLPITFHYKEANGENATTKMDIEYTIDE